MKKINYTMSLIGLLSFCAVQANVWMPALFAERHFFSFISITALLCGFLVELIFMKLLLPKVDFFKLLSCTTIMNAASATIGFLGAIVFHFMAWYVRSAVAIALGAGAPNIPVPIWMIFLYAVIFLVAMIVLNVMIEGIIAIWLFPEINRSRLLKVLYISNVLAVALSIGIMSFKIATGRLPEHKMQQAFEQMEQEDIRGY